MCFYYLGTGIEDPIEAAGRHGSNKSGVGTTSTTVDTTLVYGDSNAYRESLLKATRTRFDQLQK